MRITTCTHWVQVARDGKKCTINQPSAALPSVVIMVEVVVAAISGASLENGAIPTVSCRPSSVTVTKVSKLSQILDQVSVEFKILGTRRRSTMESQ